VAGGISGDLQAFGRFQRARGGHLTSDAGESRLVGRRWLRRADGHSTGGKKRREPNGKIEDPETRKKNLASTSQITEGDKRKINQSQEDER